MLATFKKEVDNLETEKLPTLDLLSALVYLWPTIRAILVLIKIFTIRAERLKKIDDMIAWGDTIQAHAEQTKAEDGTGNLFTEGSENPASEA